ncbi:Molybdopterin synthase catalytic subunit, partial [Operophtera brumata]
MDHLKLTVDKLLVDEISDLVSDDSCGAISMFVGTTRDNFEGKKVLRLEYEAYEPMALKAMKSICDEIREKWPAVHGIAMYHSESLHAVSHCIDRLKGSVPIWKKEVYDSADGVWKENVECAQEIKTSRDNTETKTPLDKSLVQINVSNAELQQRIQNFIERKREQVNINNIHDFIPSKGESETGEEETCARVRTQVNNEWGPQTVNNHVQSERADDTGLPSSIAERVINIENYLNIGPVPKDVYRRLKEMEDKIAYLQA